MLPSGVELLSPIEGYALDCIPEEQESQEEKGSGSLVSVCLRLRNTSAQLRTVELPAGLILISDDLSSQNGMLAQAVPLQVPAQQTLAVALHLYCINETRAPTASWDTYRLGPVTQDPGLREIINLVADKFLPVPGREEVQYAISNVTDGPGLTPQDRQALVSLPPLSAGREPGAAP
ncbi:putative lipoprotein [Hyalangium minutum]|uniref:Putative lipoprotein n=1 Tax=Hyalangium minutum TaxID=394096 RepID=A0A085WMP9_9BACT|nr:putative lipoprotein [Hyalangium minutum]